MVLPFLPAEPQLTPLFRALQNVWLHKTKHLTRRLHFTWRRWGSGLISIGGPGCITHCTVQNTTGHHRVIGLPTEVQLKCQLRGKTWQGCSAILQDSVYRLNQRCWHGTTSPTGKVWIGESRDGGRSDFTWHYCQWPTGGLCASHSFNFGLCLIVCPKGSYSCHQSPPSEDIVSYLYLSPCAPCVLRPASK